MTLPGKTSGRVFVKYIIYITDHPIVRQISKFHTNSSRLAKNSVSCMITGTVTLDLSANFL